MKASTTSSSGKPMFTKRSTRFLLYPASLPRVSYILSVSMFDVPSIVVFDRSCCDVVLVFGEINVLSWSASVFNRPFMSHECEALGVFYHHLCNLGILRVLGVWALEKHSKGEKC